MKADQPVTRLSVENTKGNRFAIVAKVRAAHAVAVRQGEEKDFMAEMKEAWTYEDVLDVVQSRVDLE